MLKLLFTILAITMIGACSSIDTQHADNPPTQTKHDWSENSGFDNDDSNEGM